MTFSHDPKDVLPFGVKNIRLVVTGSRKFTDAECVHDALQSILRQYSIRVLVHGGASGADTLSERWAKTNGVPFRRFFPDWKRLGSYAGPKRNVEMLTAEYTDMVIAFPGGKGTANCKAEARKRLIPVIEVTP